MKKSILCCVLVLTGITWGKNKKPPEPSGPIYIPMEAQEVHTIGSLWSDQGNLSDMSRDYKAHKVNDIVMIRILEKTDATQAGQVKTSRQFAASAAVSQL